MHTHKIIMNYKYMDIGNNMHTPLQKPGAHTHMPMHMHARTRLQLTHNLRSGISGLG